MDSDQFDTGSGKCRYPILQLLELSSQLVGSFDLSKFSYDAVRAGIIPALSQCAMAHREFGQGRARNWTSDTTDTMPGIGGVHVCSRIQPTRQPEGPPTVPRDTLASTDKGFARFLKKHASPTHQRVTAGGRIVPMEPRNASPQFTPSTGLISHNRTQSQGVRAESLLSQPVSNIIPALYSSPAYPGVPEPTSTEPFPPFQHSGPATTVEVPLGLGSPVFTPMMYPAHLSTPFPQDQMSMAATPMFYPTYMPMPSNFGPGYAPYVIPQPATVPLVAPEQHVMSNTNGLTDGPLSLSHLVAQATKNFEMLNEQLKDHDRYRAMRNYDPTLADQRRTIAEKRSNAKELLDRLCGAAGVKPTFKSPGSATLTAKGWNVDAPSYVPKSVRKKQFANEVKHKIETTPHTTEMPYKAPMSRRTKTNPFEADDEKTTSFDNYHSSRRAQRLVTPQKLSYEQNMVKTISLDPTKNNGQVQSTPVVFGQPSSAPYSSIKSKSEARSSIRGSGASGSPGEVYFRNKSLVLPEAREDYKKYLDALRMPRGVSSYIQYHDGSSKVVDGIGLSRPSPSNMNEWERAYWDNVERRQRIVVGSTSYRGKENSNISEQAFGNNYGLTEDEMTRRFRHLSIGKNSGKEAITHLGDGIDLDVKSLTTSKSSELNHVNIMANKTLSSVAIQSVQAVSALPLNLDGTLESVQRRLREAVSEPKVKSPRLLHRTTGGSGGWIGPYRREHQASIAPNELEPSPFKKYYY